MRLVPRAWRRPSPEHDHVAEVGEPAPEGLAAHGVPPVPLDPAPTVGRVHAGWQRNLGSRQPSLARDAGRVAGLEVAAATAAGALHLHDGIERQDAYLLIGVGGVLVAAIADGVSSEPRGGEGARAACALTAEAVEALGGRALEEVLDH